MITTTDNNITIQDYFKPITVPQTEWQTITEAVHYLSLKGITLAELEQVATNYTHKPQAVQELFWNEFWAMISYKIAKGAN